MSTTDIRNVQPLRDGLIVKREDNQKTTASGIVIPGGAQDAPNWGHVVKAGQGKRSADGSLIPMSVKVGDRVLFGQYAGTKFKCDQIEYLLLKEEDVMAVAAQ